jgi:hypothetical protein
VASPTYVSTTNDGAASNQTNMVQDIPAVDAGDRLIAIFCVVDSDAGTPPTDWTNILDYDDIHVYERIYASGASATTATFVQSASNWWAGKVIRISGSHASTASDITPVGSVAAGSNSSAPNSPSLAPAAGSADYLWLSVTCYGHAVGTDRTTSTYPTNYTSTTDADPGGAFGQVRIAAAYRALTASSEDPGAFALSGNIQTWAAITIAVPPPATTTTITTAAPTALATSLKTPNLKFTINAASPTALTTTKFVPVLNSRIVTASPTALVLTPRVITVVTNADVTVEPGNASLVVTGQAPNLRLTLNMASPSALTTTNFAPNLKTSLVMAAPSALVTTKFAPTLLHTLNMASPTALTLTGQSPLVSFGFVPGIGTLTLTGISGPTLLSAINLLTASLTLSGKQVFINPILGTASLVTTLQAPTLTATVDAFGRVVRFNAVDTSNNGTISFTPTVVDNVGTILFIPANVSQEGTMAFTVTNTSEEGTMTFDVTSSSITFTVEEA